MNKQTSLCIKAIAIIMMVATHLFGLYASSSIISITLPNGRLFSSYIGYACGLCVALFAFLTGFGLQKSFEGKSIGGVYLYSLKKIVVFLLEYWVILFSLFFPFYACTVAGAVDWMMILRSLIGWGGVLIPFSWYVYFYLGVLLTLPVVRYLFPKGRLLGVLLAYIPLTALAFVWGWLDKTDQFTLYRELIVYYVCVLGGFSFAKYGLFEAVRSGLNKVKLDHWWFYIPLSLLSMAAVSLVRNVLLFPFAILPILFACVCLFERPLPSWVLFPLSWLGKLSMPIWFIHYVFFADYINGFIPLYPMVMSPRIGIIILTFALVICIPIALIYYAFFAWIGRFVYKKNKKSV